MDAAGSLYKPFLSLKYKIMIILEGLKLFAKYFIAIAI